MTSGLTAVGYYYSYVAISEYNHDDSGTDEGTVNANFTATNPEIVEEKTSLRL